MSYSEPIANENTVVDFDSENWKVAPHRDMGFNAMSEAHIKQQAYNEALKKKRIMKARKLERQRRRAGRRRK